MKYLLLLLSLLIFSCKEKVEPKLGKLSIKGTYMKTSADRVTQTRVGDEGATVFIYNGIDMRATQYTFNGTGILKTGTQTVKYDKVYTLGSSGALDLELQYGIYAYEYASKNVSYGGVLNSVDVNEKPKLYIIDF